VRICYGLCDFFLYRRRARAFKKVRCSQGTSDVDRQSVSDVESRLWKVLDQFVNELRSLSWQPQPVRRVSMSGPEGGERRLGIPAARDRVVQQQLLDILQPSLALTFTRKVVAGVRGSCQQGVGKAEMFMCQDGRSHVVKTHLSRSSGRLTHNRILKLIRLSCDRRQQFKSASAVSDDRRDGGWELAGGRDWWTS